MGADEGWRVVEMVMSNCILGIIFFCNIHGRVKDLSVLLQACLGLGGSELCQLTLAGD